MHGTHLHHDIQLKTIRYKIYLSTLVKDQTLNTLLRKTKYFVQDNIVKSCCLSTNQYQEN